MDPRTIEQPISARLASRKEILGAFSGLMMAMLLASLDQTIVSTALPTIAADLGGLRHISWVVTGYLLTATASGPLYGKIGDLYGRKRVFEVAIVIFLIGSALSGLAGTFLQLVLYRALQGIGGRRITPPCHHDHRRPRFTAGARSLSGLCRRSIRLLKRHRPVAGRPTHR
jgi:MFS family permease